MMRYLTAILTALSLPGIVAGPALAGCYHQSYVAPVYQREVIVASFLALPVVAYPVIGAGYAPAVVAPVAPAAVVAPAISAASVAPAAVAAPVPDDWRAELRKVVRDELRTIVREEVAALDRGSPDRTTRPNLASLALGKCAVCHRADVADAKGGSFILVEKDNALASLSLDEKRKIVAMVGDGKMPPAKSEHQLASGEKAALLELFSAGRPAQNAK